MGLDGAEILMEVEDVFEIDIDDDETIGEGDVTVGDLYRHILGKLRAKGEVIDLDASAKCLSSAAFHVFRRGLCSEFCLDRRQVRPSTRMDDLVPKADRHRRWRALGERLELELPALERHRAVIKAIGGAATLIFAAGLALVYAGWVPPVAILAFTAGSVGSAVLALAVMRPLAIHFPISMQTVRGMVLRILAANWTRITAMAELTDTGSGGHLDEVWETLRSIVAEQLNIPPEQVTKRARFVKDLGVG